MTSMIGMNSSNATGGRSVMAPSATGKVSMQKAGGYRHFERPQFTGEQMDLFKSLFGHLGPDSFLGRLAGGDQEQFDQMEAPAMRQFQGLQGQLASRFSGMGMGGRRSSGFQNTMNQASSDFAQQLQANRMGLQRQALGDLMGFSSQLLGQRPFESYAAPKGKSFLQELSIGALNALGEAGKGFAQGFGANPSMQ
jgi:hypothetical protein